MPATGLPLSSSKVHQPCPSRLTLLGWNNQRPLQGLCLAQGYDVVQLLTLKVFQEGVVAKAAVPTQQGNAFAAQAFSCVAQKALDVVGRAGVAWT